MTYTPPIRRVIDLLAELRKPGARLIKREVWELSEANGWREWEVQCADGRRLTVDPRICVAAHRKGMVTMEMES